MSIEESVWTLLHQALDLYRGSRSATDRLRRNLRRFEEPLRLAIAGPWQAGKSTLVNALVGDQVAPVGTDAFVWYEDGTEPRAIAYPDSRELAVTRSAHGIRVDLDRHPVHHVVVSWPSRFLRQVTLVDTPGSADEQIQPEADGVLFLTRDAREADLQVLRDAHRGTVARAAPVHTLLVLSRADELGGGRIDALLAARQLARRTERDPRVRPLCLGVLAVSGLVGYAGRALSEPEYAALATLAATPRSELDDRLLSTDRFLEPGGAVPVQVRQELLARLGIFGLRLAATLIRTGSDSRSKLAAELVRRSGLADLREQIARCLADRPATLKARAAMVELEAVLRAEPRPGVERLRAGLEQVLAATHDFRELRLLAALRTGRLGFDGFDGEPAVEARRLVGEHGTGAPARLGVDPETPAAEQWRLAMDALARWREWSEDPLLSLDQRRVAQVVARSCEGTLTAVATALQ